MSQADRLIKRLFELPYFARGRPPIPWVWVKGDTPLYLVLGENGGGKSFFRKVLTEGARKHTKIEEVIHLSMQGRSSSGIVPAMIYGSENFQATGEITARTVMTAIETCRGRKHDHFLYWDEPDIGLSEAAELGVGIEIVKFCAKLPEHTKAVFITTHSRSLVKLLRGLKPHYIHLGTPKSRAPKNLEAWLNRSVIPLHPEEVQEASHKRYLRIQKILDGKSK
jgi:hypothetical protein